MNDEKILAVLWTLVAVSLVLFFAAVVTRASDDRQWSHVETPPTVTTPFLGGK